MPMNIVLPSLSAGMEDAVIARWLKAEGDPVAPGDVLAEVETDKATMELEAEGAGRLGRVLVADGARAQVNQVIAVLLSEGETEAAAPRVVTDSAPPPAANPACSAPPAAATQSSQPSAVGSRPLASPLARRIAAERGIALEGLAGSGPRGRIVRVDVDRAGAAALDPPSLAAPAPLAVGAPASLHAPVALQGIGPHDAIPHNGMRRTIARRLLESKTTVPHFYLQADVLMDALIDLRAEINADRPADERLSINDFVIKAAALALRKVPEANVIWTEEALLRLHGVDIAVAVATPGGLLTPVLREADNRSIGTLSAQMRNLVVRAREGRLKPEEYQGGGFSISNLGMFGVKSFTAIINPPQSAILAVGAVERRPVGNGERIVLANVLSCTLSVDHRSIDGAIGAQLLAAFRNGLEAPISLLL